MPLWVRDGEPSLVISTNDNDQRLILKSSKARNAKPNVNKNVDQLPPRSTQNHLEKNRELHFPLSSWRTDSDDSESAHFKASIWSYRTSQNT